MPEQSVDNLPLFPLSLFFLSFFLFLNVAVWVGQSDIRGVLGLRPLGCDRVSLDRYGVIGASVVGHAKSVSLSEIPHSCY